MKVIIPKNPDDTVQLRAGVDFRDRPFKPMMTAKEKQQQREFQSRLFNDLAAQQNTNNIFGRVGQMNLQKPQSQALNILRSAGVYPFGA